ncbi:MAG: glycosyltransferase family 2 protein [Gemmatimonadaceae bacterium]
MTEAPLVSIVITNYNYARFLGEAIDSALAQTYSPVEVIVVDDGSTDDSGSVVKAYGDRIVPVVRANGGMAAALNTGFTNSTGQIIVFLDSDDLLLPDGAARIAESFNEKSIAKVHWPLREVGADGVPTGHNVPPRPLPAGDLLDAMITSGPMAGNGPPTSGNAFPRWMLEKIFPIPEARLRQHADAYLNTLAPLYGTVRTLKAPQGLYRIHGTNDYASQPLLSRLYRNMEMLDYRCELLARHLSEAGIDFNREQWKTQPGSYYSNLCRRIRTLEIVADIVGPGEKFLLVDDGAFGHGPLLPARDCVRFPVDCLDSGASGVADRAIGYLEKARDSGAKFVVFTKPALWRLENHVELREFLQAKFPQTDTGDLVISFALAQNTELADCT